MMRRRKKDQRDAKRPPRVPARGAAPQSRRRGRPDAPVPAELFVRDEPASRHKPSGGGVVLVTGFDPFNGEQLNPSWEICNRLPASVAGMRVEKCKVPCEFGRSIETVAKAIERHDPELIVCIGQAGGRAHLTVERVAINIDDARIDDNGGARPVDEPIAAGGPAAYFATLPIKAMAAAMRSAGVPAHVSNTAGTYVCNHLMYGVLHYLAGSGRRARAGFIHVPYGEEQVIAKPGIAAMSLDTMVRGIEAAIAAAREHRQDIKASEGVLD